MVWFVTIFFSFNRQYFFLCIGDSRQVFKLVCGITATNSKGISVICMHSDHLYESSFNVYFTSVGSKLADQIPMSNPLLKIENPPQ